MRYGDPDGPARRARGFQLQRRDLAIPSLLISRRVGSSMVEQRPFKALVVGSSPTQPKLPFLLRNGSGTVSIGG